MLEEANGVYNRQIRNGFCAAEGLGLFLDGDSQAGVVEPADQASVLLFLDSGSIQQRVAAKLRAFHEVLINF
jgi:hypothetical protein